MNLHMQSRYIYKYIHSVIAIWQDFEDATDITISVANSNMCTGFESNSTFSFTGAFLWYLMLQKLS